MAVDIPARPAALGDALHPAAGRQWRGGAQGQLPQGTRRARRPPCPCALPACATGALALLWLCLLLAAARPQWVGEPLPIPATGRDLLLAVDVSGSMDYTDMTWDGAEVSRLHAVQKLFGDFIEGRRETASG